MAARRAGKKTRARGLGAPAALVSLTGRRAAAGRPSSALAVLHRIRVGAGILVEILHQIAQCTLVQALRLLDMPVGILLPALCEVLERLFAEVARLLMRVVGALRLLSGMRSPVLLGKPQNRDGGAGLRARVAAQRHHPKA